MKRQKTQSIYKRKPILEIVGAIFVFLFGLLFAFLLVGCGVDETPDDPNELNGQAYSCTITHLDARVEKFDICGPLGELRTVLVAVLVDDIVDTDVTGVSCIPTTLLCHYNPEIYK